MRKATHLYSASIRSIKESLGAPTVADDGRVVDEDVLGDEMSTIGALTSTICLDVVDSLFEFVFESLLGCCSLLDSFRGFFFGGSA